MTTHIQIVSVQEVEGRRVWSEETFEAACVAAAMQSRGYEASGSVGRPHLREELRGKPGFKALCGPMWGGHTPAGEPIIRYESWQAYEILSR